jgi:purine-cytosine permease-like protein
MGIDDDAATSGFAGQSRDPRPPAIPSANDEVTAAKPTTDEVYDDDALATALAAESVRLGYSGPISIVRTDPGSKPEPQPEPQPEREPIPEPVAQEPAWDVPARDLPAREPGDVVPAQAIPLADLPVPTGPPIVFPAGVAVSQGETSSTGELPPPPHRESLPDADLVSRLGDESYEPGSTLNIMKKLEEQLRLRADEARAYRDWEERMLSIGTPDALQSVERTRPDFAGLVVPSEEFLESLEAAASVEEVSPAESAAVTPGEPVAAPGGEPPVTYDLVEPVRVMPLWSSIVPSAADYPVASEPAPPIPVIDPDLGLVSTGSHAVVGPRFDVEPAVDDVDDTDRVPEDATGPFALTVEGVAIAQPGAAAAPIAPLETPRPGSGEIIILDNPRQGPRAFAFETAGVEPTAIDERIGRSARLFWLWFSANSSVLSLAFGGVIFSLGVSLRQAIVAAFVGVAISFVPLGLGTLAGKWSGQPTMIVSRATFGHLGNIVPATLAVITRLFWGAVLLWLIAASTARILVGARLAGSFSELQVTLLAMAIGFLVALVVAYFGYGLFARIQLGLSIVSALLVAGLVVLTWPSLNLAKALTIADGPWIHVVTGVVLVFSFVGLVWANSSADLARYQRPASSGAASMLFAPFGTTLAPLLLIAYGAVLAASNPATASGLARSPIDAIAAILPSWYPIPLVAAITLSLLSGVILSIYSGGFALQATGLRVQRSWSTVIIGALLFAVTVLFAFTVTDLAPLFRDVATTLAVPVAAWSGIFAAEMIIRRRRFDTDSLLTRGGVYPAVNWVNLSVLVVASLVGLGFTSATVAWLSWEGYLFGAVGVSLSSDLGGTDIGVLAALALGALTPLVAGVPRIRRQELTRP